MLVCGRDHHFWPWRLKRVPHSVCTKLLGVSNAPETGRSALAAQLLELFLEWGNDLKQVAYDSEIRHLENRSLRVLVHGNDHFGRGHPGDVLDGARDAEGQEEIGG